MPQYRVARRSSCLAAAAPETSAHRSYTTPLSHGPHVIENLRRHDNQDRAHHQRDGNLPAEFNRR
jgi:hypothetical protein